MIQALWRATIWHPDAIPDSEGEIAREVKRWVLPIVDGFLIIGSFLGIHGGMPTFAIVYNEAVSQTASVAVLAFSIACLVGVAFPRLWLVEFVGKCGLSFVLLLYALLLLALAASESPARGFVAGVCAGVAVLPVARILWLGREHRRRVLWRRAQKAGTL